MVLTRKDIFPEPALPDVSALLDRGRKLARDWTVGPSAFLAHHGVQSELAYKRRCMSEDRIMQHAQVGFREPARTRQAWREIHDTCDKAGVTVDRYGICLDWSMGYSRDDRAGRPTGTGLILDGPEDFAALTAGAPVAAHFGDFVLGFPSAVENTQAALSAGATAIGNLGQYFTFRLPDHDDDIASTEATLSALSLLAAQPVEILVHSNLDDGFAALFEDLASSLGAVLLEKYILEDLVGVRASHCFGHHFSDPLKRMAFQMALTRVSDTPGTMIYGNTVSYQGNDAQNYASLAAYLLADISGQTSNPSGHAINPVPVRENDRIPDIPEIIDAQLFAGRLRDQARAYSALIDGEMVSTLADQIVAGGRAFFENAIGGLRNAGIDVEDPFEMLLAIRRIGGRTLEREFGAPAPFATADVSEAVTRHAAAETASVPGAHRETLRNANLSVLVATTDVHEHGKRLVEEAFGQLGIQTIDGGVSVDPADIVEAALASKPDAIALSTYNGVALRFYRQLSDVLQTKGLDIPVLIGGRLNQIPSGSNTSLPVDVTDELRAAGAVVCTNIRDAVPIFLELSNSPEKAQS